MEQKRPSQRERRPVFRGQAAILPRIGNAENDQIWKILPNLERRERNREERKTLFRIRKTLPEIGKRPWFLDERSRSMRRCRACPSLLESPCRSSTSETRRTMPLPSLQA